MGKHTVHKKSDKYKVEGDKVVRQGKFCPKCGPGIYLAKHANRIHCGKCGYTEFPKKSEQKPEQKLEQKPDQKTEQKPNQKNEQKPVLKSETKPVQKSEQKPVAPAPPQK